MDNQEYDKEAHWLRLLYMVGFYIVYKVSELVVLVVVVLQAIVSTFGSAPNERLTEFGGSLAIYIAQIVKFLSFAGEMKPYPFAEWPKFESSQCKTSEKE